MLRGSKPGERRGGRKRFTPNRRTILRDRILSIGLDHPTASQRAFLLKLVKDRKLPADTRMAIASPAVVPAIRNWNPQARDALFGVVQDTTADPKARRKAALKIAEFLLPKVGKKAKFLPDEYGFVINPELVGAYRDIRLELRALDKEPTRKIPANAQKIKKLEARSYAMRRRFQLPCPSKYADKESHDDSKRLVELILLREKKTALTEAQKAEEEHLRDRLLMYRASPESIARGRRQELGDADRRFRRSRLFKDFYAPPLTRKERSELKFLRRLYPEPKKDLSRLNGDDWLEEYRDQIFAEELVASDGNFYPQNSKLRPAGVPGDVLLEEPKARIYELEKRCGRLELTSTEEEELQDLRRRHPRIAEVVSKMNLEYDFWFERELKIATKAGLDIGAAIEQAKLCCLRFEKSGCISKWDLKQLRDDGTWAWDAPE